MRDGEGVAELALIALLVVAEVVAVEEAVMEVETLLEDACEAVAARADRGASLLTEDDAAMLRERDAIVTMATRSGGDEEVLQSWGRGRSGKLDPAASAIAMPIRSPPLSESHDKSPPPASQHLRTSHATRTSQCGIDTRANRHCIDDGNMSIDRLSYLQPRHPLAFLAAPLTLLHNDFSFGTTFGERFGVGQGLSQSGVLVGGLQSGIGVPTTTW